MRAHVYVDGFNFYYGCVRGTPFKWLNFHELLRRLLPSNDIRAIKYFTARVEARPEDPDQGTRQDTYFRALTTLPEFQIILGRFLTHPVRLPRADGRGYETVLRTEEKGSDLAEPIRLVRGDLGLKIGLILPTYLRNRHPSRQLARHADFIKRIRKGVLSDSLFPDPVLSHTGAIHKPRTW